jgi:4-aminobutyrate---pyruvate transaminase
MLASNRAAALPLRDRAALLHPMTDLVRHAGEGPLTIVRGEGVRVEDEDGKSYIEGVSGLWSISLGFGQKRLADAAYRQLMELPSYHLFRHMSHPRAIELAERLLSLAPCPMSKVFFANSGSEANDTAIKLVWYYNNALKRPEKKKIISRIGGYHGVTVASASMTGLARNHSDFDIPLPGFLHTDCPSYWRYGQPGESEADFVERIARNLEALIEREGPETIAAFIAEPVMGVAGVILPPKGYFERIVPILRAHGILLIADEVITGFGRLGRMFGSEVYDLKPDILTCAKGLSSGYLPISAVMINEEIWQACYRQSGKLGVFGHGFTYSGHPVSAAVALETLAMYEDFDILGHVQKNAPILQEGLRRLSDHPLAGDARGMGLMGAVELVRDKKTKKAFAPFASIGLFAEKRCQAHGVILRALGDTIAIAPPLVAEADCITEILAKLSLALDETLEFAEGHGLA